MGSGDETARVRITVQGDVQGVGYRYFVLRRAWAAGLVGWVRNLPDGGVECLAQGGQAALDEFLGALREGPAAARVAELSSAWEPPASDLSGFGIAE